MLIYAMLKLLRVKSIIQVQFKDEHAIKIALFINWIKLFKKRIRNLEGFIAN